MDSRIEVTRVVGMLRSLIRMEVEDCKRAIRSGELEHAQERISELHDRLARAIYMLNRLR